MNKREKLQKRLLLSMTKSDKLPPAFWMPNRKPLLIRNLSGRSSLSNSSRKEKRPFDCSNSKYQASPSSHREISAFSHDRRKSLSARKKRHTSLDSGRDGDRNSSRKKIVTRIPEKALKSTFQIKTGSGGIYDDDTQTK